MNEVRLEDLKPGDLIGITWSDAWEADKVPLIENAYDVIWHEWDVFLFTRGRRQKHLVMAYAKKRARNSNVCVVVVAPSLRQSRNVRDKMEPLIMAVPRKIRRLIFRKIQRETIRLRNCSIIKFYPNSPDFIRGETVDLVYVNKAAMFRDDLYMFNQVLKHMLATTERKGHGYLYVSSTPKNKKSMFYEMCQFDTALVIIMSLGGSLQGLGLSARSGLRRCRGSCCLLSFRWSLKPSL